MTDRLLCGWCSGTRYQHAEWEPCPFDKVEFVYPRGFGPGDPMSLYPPEEPASCDNGSRPRGRDSEDWLGGEAGAVEDESAVGAESDETPKTSPSDQSP